MRNWAVIPAAITLLRAHFDRRAGRLAKAKLKIEEIQVKYPEMFDFLDAYYGFILITERDIEAAKKHFNANLRNLPDDKTGDQRYIELYCEYFLKAGSENFEWEPIIDEAHRLNADDLTKRLLVFPTKKQMISALNV